MTWQVFAAPFAAGRFASLTGTGFGEMARWYWSAPMTEYAKGGVVVIQRVVVINVQDVNASEVKNIRATSAKKERREWLRALADMVIYFVMIGCLIFAAAMWS